MLQLNLLTIGPRVAPGRDVMHTVVVNFRALRAFARNLSPVLVIGALTLGGGCDDDHASTELDASLRDAAPSPEDAGVEAEDSGADAALPADAGTDAGDAGDAALPLPDGDFALDYCQPLAQLVCERAAECG